MKTFWLIVAGACIAIAAGYLLRGDFDMAFAAAAVGIVAWFLNYRLQIKAITAAEDSRQEGSIAAKDLDEDR